MDQVVAAIHRRLAGYRGNLGFFTPGKKLLCDFYVPQEQLIIEYDERQHFTEPRALSLGEYPLELSLGFDRRGWIDECRKVLARDNDPRYRDEQRAFYDALRDILAARSGFTLIRLRHGDWDWNKPSSGQHLQGLLQKSNRPPAPLTLRHMEEWQVEVSTAAAARLGRITIASTWDGDVATAHTLLEHVCAAWPRGLRIDCLVTCGAFLRFDWPSSIPEIGDYRHPNEGAVKTLLAEAEKICDHVLDRALRTRLARGTRYLTIGIDSPYRNRIRTTANRITVDHVELVGVVDLHADPPRYHWTGKSYPTSAQAGKLVRIEDLRTHFVDLTIGKVMVLGCHDLTMFNPRAQAKARGWRKRTQVEFERMAKQERPSTVLHHPHTTVKKRTWLNAWRHLHRSFPFVTASVGTGRYHDDDRSRDEWDGLRAVLDSTKCGPVVEVVISPVG